MFNNLLQQQSEIMMFHSRPVNGFAANDFRSNNPFPISNHTTVNQVRSILVRNGRNGGSRESHRLGRHTVTFASVLIQDGIAIIDDVPRESENFDVALFVEEEGTIILNESELGFTGQHNNGNGNEEKDLLAEKIWHHLGTKFYQIPSSSSDQDSGFCAVCQSEYENGDTLGLLDCGHEYHADCIHKWLLEKNVCPLCKRTAISRLKNL